MYFFWKIMKSTKYDELIEIIFYDINFSFLQVRLSSLIFATSLNFGSENFLRKLFVLLILSMFSNIKHNSLAQLLMSFSSYPVSPTKTSGQISSTLLILFTR